MFKIIKEDKDTKARIGAFTSKQNTFPTPSFFPVATQGAVKGLSPKELDEIGIDGLLMNAYHLFLRPGVAVISKAGGLHKFTGFDKTIITDSGGYQIFSLEHLRKVYDRGVEFQSHLDGRSIFLTPEDVVKVQLDLGTDIVVPLDECVKYPAEEETADCASRRTVAWAKKSKDFFNENNHQDALFFGIVQGSVYPKIRQECLGEILSLGVDGLCIGGLSVGEPETLRYNILSQIEESGTKKLLRYFMGYGKPEDILEAVSLGIDLFDCVVPTRFGRTGTAYTRKGKIVVRNAPYTDDPAPLDEACPCFVCKRFSRAYLRHLVNAKELIGAQLLSYHNIFWYKNFIEKIREAIKEERFAEFKKGFYAEFKTKQR